MAVEVQHFERDRLVSERSISLRSFPAKIDATSIQDGASVSTPGTSSLLRMSVANIDVVAFRFPERITVDGERRDDTITEVDVWAMCKD